MDKIRIRVENMTSKHGNNIPNQFIIQTADGLFFQSYSSVIAFKPISGKVRLDAHKWDYSTTTGRYRNLFLRETKAETEKKIKSGEYELTDLN